MLRFAPSRLFIACVLVAGIAAGCGPASSPEPPSNRPELQKAVDRSKPAAKSLKGL